MAIDYYVASPNNNNHYQSNNSFPYHLNTQPTSDSSSNWSNSSPSTQPQRQHVRLYERQQSNPLQQRQSPQSPTQGNLTDSISCWSPVYSGEEDPSLKWSSESWMQGSSSDNSTTSSTDDNECEAFVPPSPCNPQTYNQNQWASPQIQPLPYPTQTANDENLFAQMMFRLNLQDQKNDWTNYPNETQNAAQRKWSHENVEERVKVSSIQQNKHFAPYIQQQSHQSPPFISTNAKWSTADGSSSAHNMNGQIQQTRVPDPRLRERQNFTQFNAVPVGGQIPDLGCDVAEIQRYHEILDQQNSLFGQICEKLLTGELKKEQLNKQVPQNFNASTSQVNSPTTKQPNLPSPSANPSPPNHSIDFALKLEQCAEQHRQLEKERKKTEAELAKHHLGKKISSANNLQIPRIPPAPSRIDRLCVDFFREHARVVTLICRMEQLRGARFGENLHAVMSEWLNAIKVLQQRRLSERHAILAHLSGDFGFYDEERELANQKETLALLIKTTIRARAANWCALIQTLGAENSMQEMQLARIQSLNFRCEPPEIQARPLKPANN